MMNLVIHLTDLLDAKNRLYLRHMQKGLFAGRGAGVDLV